MKILVTGFDPFGGELINPAIETVYIPETKHLPHMESPDEILKQITMFL